MSAEDHAKQQTSKLIGELDILKYLESWSILETSETHRLNHFIELVKRIDETKGDEVEIYDQTGKNKVKLTGKSTSVHHFEHLCILLSSVLNIALFSPAQERRDEQVTNLNKALEKLKSDKAGRTKLHPFMQDIVLKSSELILSKTEEENTDFVSFIVSHLLFLGFDQLTENSTEVFDHFNFKKSLLAVDSHIKPILIPEVADDTGEFCFLYQYFKVHLYRRPDHVEVYVADILSKLRTIKNYMNVSSLKGGKSALALLQLISFILNKLPVLETSTLGKLMLRLNYFVNLPDPLGSDSLR